MISYAPFWEKIKEESISTYRLIQDKHITPSTLQRMREDKSISLHSVEKLCKALQCNITDIVEVYHFENNSIERKKENEYP